MLDKTNATGGIYFKPFDRVNFGADTYPNSTLLFMLEARMSCRCQRRVTAYQYCFQRFRPTVTVSCLTDLWNAIRDYG